VDWTDKADVVVDTFGLLCPLPIIKAGEALKKLGTGASIEVISTDSGAIADLKQWCKANRHEYIGDASEGRVNRIWIRKG
jgi:TusA-related sulfurtransferase